MYTTSPLNKANSLRLYGRTIWQCNNFTDDRNYRSSHQFDADYALCTLFLSLSTNHYLNPIYPISLISAARTSTNTHSRFAENTLRKQRMSRYCCMLYNDDTKAIVCSELLDFSASQTQNPAPPNTNTTGTFTTTIMRGPWHICTLHNFVCGCKFTVDEVLSVKTCACLWRRTVGGMVCIQQRIAGIAMYSLCVISMTRCKPPCQNQT